MLIVPKLKQIYAVSGTHLPLPLMIVLQVTDVIRENLIWITLALVAAIVLLEWRVRWWPRYRRMVFGVSAYVLNFLTLILLALVAVAAVFAGANLLPHAK